MKMNIRLMLVAASVMLITSCETEAKKEHTDISVEEVVVDTIEVKKDTIKTKETPNKAEKKTETPKKKEQSAPETPKEEEEPKEIGASPDAVYLLDDSETESAPKCTLSDKELKKTLKKALRKAQKGEKARFKASVVIKADGTVGRVQFTECGYKDEYKPEIIAALQNLPAFIPGTKDGKAVDSWYYINYKR